MPVAPGPAATLEQWLQYIALVHPREIELGLERAGRVLEAMNIGPIAGRIITVAGSNGKGSCVAGVSEGLRLAGLRVGSFTSPHIHRFNERIEIDAREVEDAALCAAFLAIEQARNGVSLSYFEFATLAAFKLFAESELDVAVLEVGLGGRLDAVNLVDADIAVITSISLDHVEWLGNDRELIGFEKAGIMRAGQAVVCGDRELPASIATQARKLSARLQVIGEGFDIEAEPDSTTWHWRGVDRQGGQIAVRGISCAGQWPDNLATQLQVLALAGVTPNGALASRLGGLALPGRFEFRREPANGRTVLFDVAHNAAGSAVLSRRLRQYREQHPSPGQVAVVLAVMADKDIGAMAASLQSGVDIWYIAQVEQARCMPAHEVAQQVRNQGVNGPIHEFDSAQAAFTAAVTESSPAGLVLVTGSFYTVAALRGLTEPLMNLPSDAAPAMLLPHNRGVGPKAH